MRRIQLGELLLQQRLISEEQLERALTTQKRSHAPLGTILVRMGAIDEGRLLMALAAQIGVPAWDLRKHAPQAEARKAVKPELCEQYGLLPLQKRGDLLVLGMRDPLDTNAIELVRNVTNLRIEPVLVDEARMWNMVRVGRQNERTNSENVDSLVKKAIAQYGEEDRRNRAEVQTISEEDTRPVVGLVNQIVGDAIRLQASDIHIEPRYETVDVRYRIDGMLVKLREIPGNLLPMLTTRLKIMADLDIVEQRHAQDGRMTVEMDGQSVDVRVSVLPNVYGPRLVLRVLDRTVGIKEMSDIGFTEHNMSLFRTLINRPYGLFLVTGPTGSGKTTSLYAAINELRDDAANIMTVEDPVEYEIEGVSQAQIHEQYGINFADQLRATLRQDPDIILLGEIRDLETAETAIRAAMTGHLVLSTLHCNDAPSAIPRLLDLGVDPFLLSSSLIGVTAQRLLRKLCSDCRVQETPSTDEQLLLRHYFDAEGVESLWRSKGCDTCYNTGFKGRMAIHEVMPVTGDVSSVIANRGTTDELREAAEHYGYRTMQQDALERVLAGHTTLEEAKRLIAFERLLRHDQDDYLRIAV